MCESVQSLLLLEFYLIINHPTIGSRVKLKAVQAVMPACQCLHRSLRCEQAGTQCQRSPRWQLRGEAERQNTSLGRQSVRSLQPEKRVALWL